MTAVDWLETIAGIFCVSVCLFGFGYIMYAIYKDFETRDKQSQEIHERHMEILRSRISA